MRSEPTRSLVWFLAAWILTFSNVALATNGYFTHGVGSESKGMAGTGIGSNAASGPIIAASNPALAVFADDTWEIGLSIFSPMRSYKASASVVNGNFGAFTIGEGDFDSSSEAFPIPYVAKNWRLGNGSVITTAFYGRGGMNTDWDNSAASATSLACDSFGQAVVTGPGPDCSGNAGVDLSQAFLSVTIAGKASDKFTWGIGPVFAVQLFEAKGVGSFAGFTNTFAASGGTVFPTTLSDNGHEISTGVGALVGLWFSFSDAGSAGFSYQSKLSMSEFDDYSDLFAEDGGFDIPASTKFGLSIIGSNNARLNLDIEHTEFGDVESVGNLLANIGACPTAGLGGTDLESCLGGQNGAGFCWDDMTTYKVGVEWKADETTTWRAGVSYGEQPIQEADVLLNILAPGVMEKHFTVGMTKRRSNGGAWTVSIMYAPEKTVEGLNLFDPTQTIELKMKQFEFEVSYLW